MILHVHFPNMQFVFFKENTRIKQVVDHPTFGSSLLLVWFDNNKWDVSGHDLTYTSYPTKYWWDKEVKAWKRRERSTSHALRRLIFVHPSAIE